MSIEYINEQQIAIICQNVKAMSDRKVSNFSNVKLAYNNLQFSWTGATAEKAFPALNKLKNEVVVDENEKIHNFVNFLQDITNAYVTAENKNRHIGDEFL